MYISECVSDLIKLQKLLKKKPVDLQKTAYLGSKSHVHFYLLDGEWINTWIWLLPVIIKIYECVLWHYHLENITLAEAKCSKQKKWRFGFSQVFGTGQMHLCSDTNEFGPAEGLQVLHQMSSTFFPLTTYLVIVSQALCDGDPDTSAVPLTDTRLGQLVFTLVAVCLIIRSLAFRTLCLAIGPIDLLLQGQIPDQSPTGPICIANGWQHK